MHKKQKSAASGGVGDEWKTHHMEIFIDAKLEYPFDLEQADPALYAMVAAQLNNAL